MLFQRRPEMGTIIDRYMWQVISFSVVWAVIASVLA